MIRTITTLVPGSTWVKPGGALSFEAILIAIVVTVALILLQALLVMILWNLTLPKLFNFPCLSYGQALGITLLVIFLFGV